MDTGSGASSRGSDGGQRDPRVFISYAHDSAEHKAQVAELGELLRGCGVDARWDTHLVRTPVRRDWSTTVLREIDDADYVLVVASPECKRVGDGLAGHAERRGLEAEMQLLRDRLSGDRPRWQQKILPVLLPGHDRSQIPSFLSPHNLDHFPIAELTADGLADLRRYLHHPPPAAAPPAASPPATAAVRSESRSGAPPARARRAAAPARAGRSAGAVRPALAVVLLATLLSGAGYWSLQPERGPDEVAAPPGTTPTTTQQPTSPPPPTSKPPVGRPPGPPPSATASPSRSPRPSPSRTDPRPSPTASAAVPLVDLRASEGRGVTTDSCETGGRVFDRSLLLTMQGGFARVDYDAPPSRLTTLEGWLGVADTDDPNQKYPIDVYVQSGPTSPDGTTPKAFDRKLLYGDAAEIRVRITPGAFLRIQASAGATRTLCLGDLRLTSG